MKDLSFFPLIFAYFTLWNWNRLFMFLMMRTSSYKTVVNLLQEARNRIWHGAGSYEILYSSFFSSIFFIFLANFWIRLFKVAKNMLNILFFDWFGTSFQWFRAMSDEIRWKMTQNSKKMDDNFRIPCVIGDVACLHGLAECADASYLSLP